MNDVLTVVAANAVLTLAAALTFRIRTKHLSAVQVLWMLLLPLFGPAAFFWSSFVPEEKSMEGEWLLKGEERMNRIFRVEEENRDVLPIEEVLLVNDSKERRRQIMSLLHEDPKRNLDLLLLARFNDDMETAHYATATISELQRRIQMELQKYQSILSAHPQDRKTLAEYVDLLAYYCDSGLLESQLLHRQRMKLADALDTAFALEPTVELASLALKNRLALGQPAEARMIAEDAVNRWPGDERVWLEKLRFCVDTHDRTAFRETLAHLENGSVNLSASGSERLKFWMEKQA